jgi:hypothetical protein
MSLQKLKRERAVLKTRDTVALKALSSLRDQDSLPLRFMRRIEILLKKGWKPFRSSIGPSLTLCWSRRWMRM